MTLPLLFWLVMLITAVYALWLGWPRAPEQRYALTGSALWWVLLFIVGWGVFGPPLRA